MLHLAIQTIEKPDNFCLMDDEKIVFQKFIDGSDFSSDSLFSEMKIALEENKIEANKISFITAVVGPGSFTGIKSGLAFAKGFAYGLNLPIVSVSSLEAIAQSVVNEEKGDVMAMIDARHERVYSQVFSINDNKLTSKTEIVVDEVRNVLKSNKLTRLIGSGAVINSKLIQELGDYKIYEKSNIDSSIVAILGLEKFRRKEIFDTYSITPLFISEPKITINSNI